MRLIPQAVGIFDFLKPKSAVEKAAKQVREAYAQPDYRREAMQKLLKIGTEEAYDALLTRFSVKANGQIADEQEKRDLVEELVAVGEPALPSVERYIFQEKTAIAFPIRILKELVPEAVAVDKLLMALAQYEPLDHLSSNAKVALVDGLADILPKSQASVLFPYLNDHSDDVQASVIDVVENIAPEGVTEALVEICTQDQHSGRIIRRAAKALSVLETPVRAWYDKFDEELKDAWILGKKGQLVPRKNR